MLMFYPSFTALFRNNKFSSKTRYNGEKHSGIETFLLFIDVWMHKALSQANWIFRDIVWQNKRLFSLSRIKHSE